MGNEYAEHKKEEAPVTKEELGFEGGPSMAALRSGAAAPTPNQRGRQVDLPDAMRSKMENAFGADLSAVRLFESRAVAESGASAYTQGADIAFAPGLLDFSSFRGQALLGHEISHAVSQARGEVTGGGFLNDASLEARADREGAMAAAGQQIAMPTAALSPVTVGATTGPLQAAGKPKKTAVPGAPAAAAAGTTAAPPPAPANATGPAPAGTTTPAQADDDNEYGLQYDASTQPAFPYRQDLDVTRLGLDQGDVKTYDTMMQVFLRSGLETKTYRPVKERTTKNGYLPPSEDMFRQAAKYDPSTDPAPGTKEYERAFQQFRKNRKNWYDPKVKRYNDLMNKVTGEQRRQNRTYIHPNSQNQQAVTQPPMMQQPMMQPPMMQQPMMGMGMGMDMGMMQPPMMGMGMGMDMGMGMMQQPMMQQPTVAQDGGPVAGTTDISPAQPVTDGGGNDTPPAAVQVQASSDGGGTSGGTSEVEGGLPVSESVVPYDELDTPGPMSDEYYKNDQVEPLPSLSVSEDTVTKELTDAGIPLQAPEGTEQHKYLMEQYEKLLQQQQAGPSAAGPAGGPPGGPPPGGMGPMMAMMDRQKGMIESLQKQLSQQAEMIKQLTDLVSKLSPGMKNVAESKQK